MYLDRTKNMICPIMTRPVFVSYGSDEDSGLDTAYVTCRGRDCMAWVDQNAAYPEAPQLGVCRLIFPVVPSFTE